VIVRIENFQFSQAADIQQNPLTADANRYTERYINNAVAPVSYCCWREPPINPMHWPISTACFSTFHPTAPRRGISAFPGRAGVTACRLVPTRCCPWKKPVTCVMSRGRGSGRSIKYGRGSSSIRKGLG